MSSVAPTLWQTFKNAWQQRETLGEATADKQQRLFLPAALEIQETPPSPLGRVVIWTVISFFVLGILWACLGQVDIVTSAEGKIVPSRQIKVIQPFEKGVVSKILVAEGERVEKGQALIELDRTLTLSDQQRLSQALQTQRLQWARFKTLEQWYKAGAPPTVALENVPEATPTHRIEAETQLAYQQWLHFESQKGALASELEDRKAQKATSQEIIRKLAQTLPLISERVDSVKRLVDRAMAPKMQYLELEQERIQQAQDLAAEKARQVQLNAAIEHVQQQLKALTHETHINNLNQMARAQQEIDQLTEELGKANALDSKQILYSPVEGVVQQLVIHTVGGVVTPAQQLMSIVPTNEQLVVEAYLENKDIGFVHETQPAEIKVHTFPFTKYGVINATVIGVSPDAVADEEQGLRYKMRLLMEASQLHVNERLVDLIPGMAVTAEVKTGKRRIIEFVTAPLLRYRQESVRER